MDIDVLMSLKTAVVGNIYQGYSECVHAGVRFTEIAFIALIVSLGSCPSTWTDETLDLIFI